MYSTRIKVVNQELSFEGIKVKNLKIFKNSGTLGAFHLFNKQNNKYKHDSNVRNLHWCPVKNGAWLKNVRTRKGEPCHQEYVEK